VPPVAWALPNRAGWPAILRAPSHVDGSLSNTPYAACQGIRRDITQERLDRVVLAGWGHPDLCGLKDTHFRPREVADHEPVVPGREQSQQRRCRIADEGRRPRSASPSGGRQPVLRNAAGAPRSRPLIPPHSSAASPPRDRRDRSPVPNSASASGPHRRRRIGGTPSSGANETAASSKERSGAQAGPSSRPR